MATLKTLRTTTAVALAVTLLTAGCGGGDDPTPTSPATSSTTSTTSSSSTSSSTTPATPTGAEAASAAVIAFYKELDAVAQGKARLDSFRHATTDGKDTGTTLPKWQGAISSQRGRGILQVGDTVVTITDTAKGKKAEAGGGLWPSWVVTACIDHSQSHLEQKGKTVDWPGQMREQVTHVVVDTGDGDFAIVRDDPGKSC
jgi:hypothetical protein